MMRTKGQQRDQQTEQQHITAKAQKDEIIAVDLLDPCVIDRANGSHLLYALDSLLAQESNAMIHSMESIHEEWKFKLLSLLKCYSMVPCDPVILRFQVVHSLIEVCSECNGHGNSLKREVDEYNMVYLREQAEEIQALELEYMRQLLSLSDHQETESDENNEARQSIQKKSLEKEKRQKPSTRKLHSSSSIRSNDGYVKVKELDDFLSLVNESNEKTSDHPQAEEEEIKLRYDYLSRAMERLAKDDLMFTEDQLRMQWSDLDDSLREMLFPPLGVSINYFDEVKERLEYETYNYDIQLHLSAEENEQIGSSTLEETSLYGSDTLSDEKMHDISSIEPKYLSDWFADKVSEAGLSDKSSDDWISLRKQWTEFVHSSKEHLTNIEDQCVEQRLWTDLRDKSLRYYYDIQLENVTFSIMNETDLNSSMISKLIQLQLSKSAKSCGYDLTREYEARGVSSSFSTFNAVPPDIYLKAPQQNVMNDNIESMRCLIELCCDIHMALLSLMHTKSVSGQLFGYLSIRLIRSEQILRDLYQEWDLIHVCALSMEKASDVFLRQIKREELENIGTYSFFNPSSEVEKQWDREHPYLHFITDTAEWRCIHLKISKCLEHTPSVDARETFTNLSGRMNDYLTLICCCESEPLTEVIDQLCHLNEQSSYYDIARLTESVMLRLDELESEMNRTLEDTLRGDSVIDCLYICQNIIQYSKWIYKYDVIDKTLCQSIISRFAEMVATKINSSVSDILQHIASLKQIRNSLPYILDAMSIVALALQAQDSQSCPIITDHPGDKISYRCSSSQMDILDLACEISRFEYFRSASRKLLREYGSNETSISQAIEDNLNQVELQTTPTLDVIVLNSQQNDQIALDIQIDDSQISSQIHTLTKEQDELIRLSHQEDISKELSNSREETKGYFNRVYQLDVDSIEPYYIPIAERFSQANSHNELVSEAATHVFNQVLTTTKIERQLPHSHHTNTEQISEDIDEDIDYDEIIQSLEDVCQNIIIPSNDAQFVKRHQIRATLTDSLLYILLYVIHSSENSASQWTSYLLKSEFDMISSDPFLQSTTDIVKQEISSELDQTQADANLLSQVAVSIVMEAMKQCEAKLIDIITSSAQLINDTVLVHFRSCDLYTPLNIPSTDDNVQQDSIEISTPYAPIMLNHVNKQISSQLTELCIIVCNFIRDNTMIVNQLRNQSLSNNDVNEKLIETVIEKLLFLVYNHLFEQLHAPNSIMVDLSMIEHLLHKINFPLYSHIIRMTAVNHAELDNDMFAHWEQIALILENYPIVDIFTNELSIEEFPDLHPIMRSNVLQEISHFASKVDIFSSTTLESLSISLKLQQGELLNDLIRNIQVKTD